MERRTIVQSTLALTNADAEYELAIPADATEFVARLAVASTWRWSATSGVVAGAGAAAFPLASGEDLQFDGPLKACTIFIANDAAGGTMHYSYCVPYRTRP